MPRKSDAREKFVRTAARLFQEQGYSATGLTQIIEASGAPKGSFYFHFPEGKEQLAVEAVTVAGTTGEALLRELAASTPDPADFVRAYAAGQARTLERSGYRQGCPIATITLEMAADSEPIRRAADHALASWTQVLADVLRTAGHPSPDALARHAIAAIEGALLLARARHSPEPLTETADLLAALITAQPR
ncbi:TetR/AcrR family transcriptional regulator [Spirillospora sp. CA-294931]|uniref:TetR/AcrR family transcriptional regulator n=1 Tax=Spirillospora sp. CA-294931 TaxID=3240042 RepID=UPI003D8EF9E0